MKTLIYSLFLIVVIASSNVSAQTQIAPEKMKALKELITLVNQDNKSETVMKSMMQEMDKLRDATMQSLIADRSDLSETQKNELKVVLVEESNRLSKKLQENLFKKVNFNQILEEIMIGLYDKNYSTEELNDLLAFYKTPTGQKTLKITQKLMEDSMRLSEEKLLPIIVPIIQETMDSDRQELKKKMEDSSKSGKNN